MIRIISDIVTSTNHPRRSIREVPLSSEKDSSERTPSQQNADKLLNYLKNEERSEPEGHRPEPHKENMKPKKHHNYGVWAVAVLVLVGTGVGAMHFLSSATVEVSIKELTASVEVTSDASLNGVVGIPVTIGSITKEDSVTVPSDGEVSVEKKATGKILIFNNSGTKPQRLIKNTRFETKDGIVYRIDKSVVVPGGTYSGSKLTPGNVEVTVYADKSGEESNLLLSALKGDLTIPGFKGDSRFSTIYGRQKTDIAGGFKGMQKIVSAKKESDVRLELREKLRNNVLPSRTALREIVIYVDPSIAVFETLLNESASSNNIVIREKISVPSFSFRMDDIAKIVGPELAREKGLTVSISNPTSLTFNLVSPVPFKDEVANTGITFTLSGRARGTYSLDQNKLLESILGVNRNSVASVLSTFPAIEKAEVTIRPFWKQSIPTENDKIDLILSTDN